MRMDSQQRELYTTIRNLRKELRDLRESHLSAEQLAKSLQKKNHQLELKVFADATRLGLAPEQHLSSDDARNFARRLLTSGKTLALLNLVRDDSLLQRLTATQLRKLGKQLHTAGYWRTLIGVQDAIYKKSGNDSDKQVLEKTVGRVSVFEDPMQGLSDQVFSSRRTDGPVIHVVGNDLAGIQTGYTVRTAYSVRAQLDLGIPALVAVQPGSRGQANDVARRVVHAGVEYVRLPGRGRGKDPLDDWLHQFVHGLESLIEEEQPSLLHAHSDFLNGAAAIIAGRKHGIPVIYESRGFWEESWLSRFSANFNIGLDPADSLKHVGLPDAYTLRQHAEESVRASADAIITLADVMKSHILDSHGQDLQPSIHIIPNAVDANDFRPQEPDQDLAHSLGIHPDSTVVGYVTSMVEYEGVDVLIRGFAKLRELLPERHLHLLLVGTGAVLGRLKRLAAELELDDGVTFTGQVPHDNVRNYYSLIDIFVVPRRPSRVSHLVTPLKPFEAMAMGKPVVVSDVTALKEIANKSGAAQTFIANNPEDLSDVLANLVEDTKLRTDLGERARRWAKEVRSWGSNARQYLDVYKTLGANWQSRQEQEKESSLQRVQDYLRDNPPPHSGWFVLGKPKDSPQVIMQEGWRYSDYPRIRLDQHIDWAKYPEIDRSMAFWLQSWSFMDSFVASDRQPSLGEIQFLISIVKQWHGAVGAMTQSSESEDAMAYYDMALALRAPRLLLLIWLADRWDETRSEVAWLIELLFHERQALREEAAFTPHTNHGFYTAAAQLHMEKFLPELVDHTQVYAQAIRRMDLLIGRQFANDGGHLEHSATYHRLLLESFTTAVDEGLIEDSEMKERLERAQHVFGWMIQPDGVLVSLGDTEPSKQTMGIATKDQATKWIISDGESGKPTETELMVLPESGYAFIRSPQPSSPGTRIDSSYLAFQAGFHSRAHKHADDLSFIWFDRGQEILIDAGKWAYGPLLPADSPLRADGYYYAAPERQYVESVSAHNTVEIDNRIHDRTRKPYGSGLIDATSSQGEFRIEAAAPHGDYSHNRTLTLNPGSSLEVSDSIASETEDQRHASAWFLLNGELELIFHSDSKLTFRLSNGEMLEISSTGVLEKPVRGQKNPLLGWRSTAARSLEPAWSLRIVEKFHGTGNIRTVFRVQNETVRSD